MNKQLLTATGEAVVLFGNYDDDSHCRVFLSSDVVYSYETNAAGEGIWVGTFTLDHQTASYSINDFDPEDEAYHSFNDHAKLVRNAGLYISSTSVKDQVSKAIGVVRNYEELVALLAKH